MRRYSFWYRRLLIAKTRQTNTTVATARPKQDESAPSKSSAEVQKASDRANTEKVKPAELQKPAEERVREAIETSVKELEDKAVSEAKMAQQDANGAAVAVKRMSNMD